MGFVLALLFLASCGSVPHANTPHGQDHRHWIAGDDAVLASLGRTIRDEGRVRFAWTGSGVSARFTGAALHARVRAVTRDDGHEDYLQVDVDGVTRMLTLHAGEQDIVVAEGLGPGPHLCTLRKRTEPRVGTIELLALGVGGEERFLPLPPRTGPRLEVLGDSISTAFGNECDAPDQTSSPRLQNGVASYGVIAGELLGAADVSIVAWSGKGVLRNAERDEPDPLPSLWTFALPLERVPMTDDEPDVVLINLGGNDFGGPEPSLPDPDAFARAFDDLLSDVRRQRPTALLVVLLNSALSDDDPSGLPLRSAVKDALLHAVERAQRRGEGRIAFLEQSPASGDEGFGCSYHPSLRTHRRLGRELADALRALLARPESARE